MEVRRRRNRPTSATARAIEEDAFSAAVRAHSQDFGADEEPKVGRMVGTVVETYLAPPVGRILPSLVEDHLRGPVHENPELPLPVTPSGTSTKTELAQDASSSLQCDERRVERPELARLGAAVQLVVPKCSPLQSDEGQIGVVSSRVKRTEKPNNDASAAQSTNSKTRAGRKKASAPLAVAVATDERRSMSSALLDAASDGDLGVSSERRGLILGRYVRGTELKFGERWKLRLRKERR